MTLTCIHTHAHTTSKHTSRYKNNKKRTVSTAFCEEMESKKEKCFNFDIGMRKYSILIQFFYLICKQSLNEWKQSKHSLKKIYEPTCVSQVLVISGKNSNI